MSELFGTPSGFRAYDKDQAELAQMAATTQHQRALAGLNNAQADTMRRKQASEEQLLSIIAGKAPAGAQGGTTSPDEILGQMSRAAGIYASVGRFDEAGKIIKDVSQATENFAQTKSAAAAAATAELRAHTGRLRLLQERLATVNSPAKHAEVLMQLQADPLIGSQIPAWLKTYNPNAIRGFVAGSPAQIEQAELAIKQADLARKNGDSESLRRLRETSAEVKKRLATVAETRAEHLTKAGAGKDTGIAAATTADILAAKQQLKSAGYSAAADDANMQAAEIAERARILRSSNPAVGPTEALDRVIAESVAAGEVQVNRVMPNKYAPKPGAISRPLPLPTSLADAKKGSYYRLANGSLVKHLGGDNFEVVAQPRKKPQVQPRSRDPIDELLNDEGEEE